MKIFKSLKYICGLLLILCIQSCSIDDDRTDCPDGITISFKYKYSAQQTSDIFDRVDLFVFDEQGVLQYHDELYDLPIDGTYRKHMDLLPGKYTFVAWGGLADKRFALRPAMKLGETTLDSFRMFLQERGANNTITYKPHALIWGEKKDFEVIMKGNQLVTVPMVKDNNTIHVDIRQSGSIPGRTSSGGIAGYELNLSINNGTYLFNNAIDVTDTPLVYTPFYSQKDESRIITDFHVLRLVEGNKGALFTLSDPVRSKLIINTDLIELILKINDIYGTRTIDFERDDYFEIIIELDQTDAVIRITVNGWVIVEQNDENPG